MSATTDRLDEPTGSSTTGWPAPEATRADQRGWRESWPLRGPEALRLLVAYVAVAGTGVLVGMLLTDWAAPNAITRFDDRAANWFADNRTSALNSLAPWAAGTADTYIKIGISTVIVLFLLWKFRRWGDALYVALPLVFEALCFITITKIVQRPRPDVERLLESTIDSSLPSGHVAAATVYAAVVIVIWRHQRSTVIRVLSASVFAVVLAGVIWARLYQGMHFVSDVVLGVILGVVSLYISDRILTAAAAKRSREHPAPNGAPVAEGV